MKAKTVIFVAVSTLAIHGLMLRSINAAEQTEFRGKLSTLKSCNEILGNGWNGPEGLLIDDIHDLSPLKETEQRAAQSLVKSVSGEKIVALADFTYTRKDRPKIITVRVFVFQNADAAQQWWKKKYEGPGWEKRYEKMSGLGDRAVKSKETTKEMVLQGNVWITSHQLHEGDEFHRALQHYLKEMFNDDTKQAAVSQQQLE